MTQLATWPSSQKDPSLKAHHQALLKASNGFSLPVLLALQKSTPLALTPEVLLMAAGCVALRTLKTSDFWGRRNMLPSMLPSMATVTWRCVFVSISPTSSSFRRVRCTLALLPTSRVKAEMRSPLGVPIAPGPQLGVDQVGMKVHLSPQRPQLVSGETSPFNKSPEV